MEVVVDSVEVVVVRTGVTIDATTMEVFIQYHHVIVSPTQFVPRKMYVCVMK